MIPEIEDVLKVLAVIVGETMGENRWEISGGWEILGVVPRVNLVSIDGVMPEVFPNVCRNS